MSIMNWFKTKPTESIEDMTEIVAKPEIVLPEPTRKELFDAAVREVSVLRVSSLIKRDMIGKIHGYDVLNDTLNALREFTDTTYVLDSDKHLAVLEQFPKAHFEDITGGWNEDTIVRLQLPSISVDDITKYLAEEYVGE